jgi:hypothetical protein
MRLRIDVRIKKPANHALVLGLVPRCFGFEEFDALLTQGQRDFHALFAESQLGRRRKKIWDNANLTNRLIGVFDFCAHKLPFLCANNRRL